MCNVIAMLATILITKLPSPSSCMVWGHLLCQKTGNILVTFIVRSKADMQKPKLLAKQTDCLPDNCLHNPRSSSPPPFSLHSPILIQSSCLHEDLFSFGFHYTFVLFLLTLSSTSLRALVTCRVGPAGFCPQCCVVSLKFASDATSTQDMNSTIISVWVNPGSILTPDLLKQNLALSLQCEPRSRPSDRLQPRSFFHTKVRDHLSRSHFHL